MAIAAITTAGGVAESSADLHVHEDGSHICIDLVGVPNVDGLHGFVMFCDMPM